MQPTKSVGSGQEVLLGEEEILVSKTDTKGKITYANRAFMNVSGFYEQKLLGRPHNMIRHQDMPRGVFRLMWRTLQSGEEFFGFVKNSCADGSYYWVFANVTLDLDENGALKGYFSVRRYPPREAIKFCEEVYAKMRSIEASNPGNGGVDKSLSYLLDLLQKDYPSYNEAMLALYGKGV